MKRLEIIILGILVMLMLGGQVIKRGPHNPTAPTTTNVSSLAGLDACLETRTSGTCYVSATITHDYDPAGGTCITGCDHTDVVMRAEMPDTFDTIMECAPGTEIRLNNVDADYDTANIIDWLEFLPQSTIDAHEGVPHTLRIKNCTFVEYRSGTRGDTKAGVGGGIGLLFKSEDAGDTWDTDINKSTRLILDNTKVLMWSSDSEAVAASPGANILEIINGSYVQGASGVLAKGACDGCEHGLPFLLNNSTIESWRGGVCDDDGTEAGAHCETNVPCGGGTCVSPVGSIALTQMRDVAMTITNNSVINGTIHIANANAGNSYISTITNSFLGGPGEDAGNSLFVLYAPETVILDNVRLGNSWPTPRNNEIALVDAGSIKGNAYFAACPTGSLASAASAAGGDETTITMAAAHGLRNWDSITIVNTDAAVLDGTFQVKNVTPTTVQVESAWGADATPNGTYDVNQLWKSGGARFDDRIVAIAAAPGDPISEIALKITGPAGCYPGSLITYNTGLTGLADKDVDGFIDAGPEVGRMDFADGELTSPPGCHQSIICRNVTLDEDFIDGDDKHYIDLHDCSVNDDEDDADNKIVNTFFPTRICGFYAVQDAQTGTGFADSWNYTVRAGAAGSLGDTDSACVIGDWYGQRCWGHEGIIDPSDAVTMEIEPIDTPGDNVVDFVIWLDAIERRDAGAAPSASCTPGEIFIDTDEGDDTNCTTTSDNSICLCIATDTWVQLDNH